MKHNFYKAEKVKNFNVLKILKFKKNDMISYFDKKKNTQKNSFGFRCLSISLMQSSPLMSPLVDN